MNQPCAVHPPVQNVIPGGPPVQNVIPIHPPAPNVAVALGHINIPEYYIGAIPADVRPLYKLFDIHYVRVKNASNDDNTDYYIYRPNLAAVVARLNLHT